ncbi:hypothetical protein [Nocardia arizonensis]|uniref:hypothetical protein n=1 Tax=Nocardia arizonensis TaxID=1141647 RepID=UPI0006D0D520|nr:hypothetical protein [Nocardia arizonensis]
MLYENPAAGTRPGGAVATTTIVLALAGVVLNLVGAARLGIDFYSDPGHFDNSLAILTVLSSLLLAGALIYGCVLIYRGDTAGRYFVLVGAGTWATIALIGVLSALSDHHSEYGVRWFADASRPIEALFATCGLAGAITAMLDGDWVVNAAAAALPVVTALTAASHGTE